MDTTRTSTTHAPTPLVFNQALFKNFFLRELRGRYLGSITGFLWAFLHPVILLIVYHFVFTTVFKADRFGSGTFLGYVAIALWPWLACQEGIQRGATSILNYSGLIRKVAFSHELIVYATVGATLALQLAGYLVILIALSIYGEPLHLSGVLLVIPLWIVLAVGVVGIALFFSALQVFIRDIEHILMPTLMILMYLAPVLYPLSRVPEEMQIWVSLNPFTWLVERLRDVLLNGDISLRWSDLLAVGIALALYWGGRWVFRRLSPHFEDFV